MTAVVLTRTKIVPMSFFFNPGTVRHCICNRDIVNQSILEVEDDERAGVYSGFQSRGGRYVYVWISRDEISLKREKSKERSVSVLDISS